MKTKTTGNGITAQMAPSGAEATRVAIKRIREACYWAIFEVLNNEDTLSGDEAPILAAFAAKELEKGLKELLAATPQGGV